MRDRIQELVTKAHTYFNQTLTSTVADMDQKSAMAFQNECYGFPCPVKIEKYLALFGGLKSEVDG